MGYLKLILQNIDMDEKVANALRWIISIFEKHNVKYQLTGGFAAHLYGATRPINDLDLDIPEEDFPKILPDINEYIIYGPAHYKNEKWDLDLITLNYKGQEIDLGGAYKTKIFDDSKQKWIRSPADLSNVFYFEVDGIKVKTVPPHDLIEYKSLLGGDHQEVDINAVKEYLAKPKSILITGIAGSGKSTVCAELKNLGHNAYSIEDMEGMFKMVDSKTGEDIIDHDNDDLEANKGHDWICDIKKLRKLMDENKGKTTFYCGTASNLDDILPLFDMLFFLNASKEELRKRLSRRSSDQFGRTPEVQEWVFSWMDWWEERMRKKGAIFVNADLDIKKVVSIILEKSL